MKKLFLLFLLFLSLNGISEINVLASKGNISLLLEDKPFIKKIVAQISNIMPGIIRQREEYFLDITPQLKEENSKVICGYLWEKKPQFLFKCVVFQENPSKVKIEFEMKVDEGVPPYFAQIFLQCVGEFFRGMEMKIITREGTEERGEIFIPGMNTNFGRFRGMKKITFLDKEKKISFEFRKIEGYFEWFLWDTTVWDWGEKCFRLGEDIHYEKEKKFISKGEIIIECEKIESIK